MKDFRSGDWHLLESQGWFPKVLGCFGELWICFTTALGCVVLHVDDDYHSGKCHQHIGLGRFQSLETLCCEGFTFGRLAPLGVAGLVSNSFGVFWRVVGMIYNSVGVCSLSRLGAFHGLDPSRCFGALHGLDTSRCVARSGVDVVWVGRAKGSTGIETETGTRTGTGTWTGTGSGTGLARRGHVTS